MTATGHAKVAARLAGVVVVMGGARLGGGAVLRLVLPHHRLRAAPPTWPSAVPT